MASSLESPSFINQTYFPEESTAMKIPRPDQTSVAFFRSLVPDDPHVTVRPMFGNVSAFVNGNMFFGLFGNDLFLRLSAPDQQEFLKNKEASFLEPMKDYIIIPKEWMKDPNTVRSWVSRSFLWSSKLPPKKKAGKS